MEIRRLCAFRLAVPSERYFICEKNLLYPFVSSFCTPPFICYSRLFFTKFVSSFCTPSIICYSRLFFTNFVSVFCSPPFICYFLLFFPRFKTKNRIAIVWVQLRMWQALGSHLSPNAIFEFFVALLSPSGQIKFADNRVLHIFSAPLFTDSTDSPLLNSTVHVPEGLERVPIWYACGQLSIYMQGSPVETSEPEWRHQDRPAPCVDAQQYSSATCVSVLFHYCTEKFGALFENLI